MEKRVTILIFLIALIGFVPHASAVTIEAADMRLGINGYVNGLYTYMSKTPTSMGGTMADTSTFETKSHLLVNAVKDKFRININLEFDNSGFASGSGMGSGDITGKFGVLETFGEYGFSESLQVRVGNFLTPFGIYNEIRYITPLFATVVLPMMYEPPVNYEGSPLTPDNTNVMLFGSYSVNASKIYYNIYAGNGGIGGDGKDQNKNKGLGGRIRVALPYNVKIGGSYYSVEDEPVKEGRENLYGIDLDINLRDLNLQAEYVVDNAEKVEDRLAYYIRLVYPIDQFTPFIGYDYMKDKGDTLFERGLQRYSVGTGYTVNNYITLKAEYHYHTIDDTSGPMAPDPEDVHMLTGAAIFIF